MSFDLNDIFVACEEKWLEDLRVFFKDHFKKVFLPSHDYSHHLRTWQYARKILLTIWQENKSLDQDFVEAVLLACMFHDSGMAVSRNPNHGAISKSIFEGCIENLKKGRPAIYKDIVEAIEFHDRKELDTHVPFPLSGLPDLTTLVSIADDLDALGIIGVYRYAEIYLQRNISMTDLGIKILHNVALRYNHFSKASALYPSLIDQTKQAYSQIIAFYDAYNQQLLSDLDPYIVYSGHIGIINYIRTFSVEGRIEPVDFIRSLDNFIVGKFVSDFFNDLYNEYNKFRS